MSRYIDVDKFAEKICNFQQIDEDAANAMIWLLRTFPTADVVEVVRCKDCQWWSDRGFDPILNRRDGCCDRPLGEYYECDCDFVTTENDFCSYGERSENGT